jgi:general secretion pathway protein K
MKKLSSEKGIALLLVLWTLTILMVIVLSFSFTIKAETSATLSFKEGVEKRFLAEAGIERGIMELFYRSINKGQTVILEGREVWNVDGTPYPGKAGGGSYTVAIYDESGKLNINKMNDSNAIIFKNLLKNIGVPEKDVDGITDSVLDWKDPNKGMHRLNGAGDDYYSSLPNPYEPKHADFDTIEELLLVKGMTPEILYGGGEKKGIAALISVMPGSTPQININAAPKDLLLAVPDVTPEIADAIVSLRQAKDITNIGEIPGINAQTMNLYLTTVGGTTFSIEALGYKEDEKTGYAARAAVTIEGNSKFRYLSYKSPARMSPGTRKETQNQEG